MAVKFSKSSLETFLFPVILLILNLILKGLFINSGDISGDEPFTIFYAQQDIPAILSKLSQGNNPPLFEIILHFWINLWGISAFSTRFLPMLFSTLTVLVIYKTGLKFFNLRIAIITSLLFTFSNYHIFFAHETRVYSLFALLTSISMYSFLSLLKDKAKLKHFILIVLSNTLLIYSHFFGFFILLIQMLSILTIKEVRKNLFINYLLITGITILLYLPYIKLLTIRFAVSAKGTWIPAPHFEDLYNNLWKFSNAPVNTVIYLLILTTALIFIILKRNKPDGIPSAYSKIILIWFLVPYLLIFTLSFITPMFLDRYLVFISIGYYFAIALSINYLGRPNWLFYTLSTLSVLLMIITCNPRSDTNRNTGELVNTIKQLRAENTPVYICPDWIDLGFVYYYNINYFKDYKQTRNKLNADKIFPINNVDQINDSLLSTSKSAVYLDSWAGLVDKNNQIFEKLHANFKNVETKESFHGYKIYYFSRE